MSAEKIYGVDLSKKVTPLIVRDAIVECFYLAHCADADLGIEKSIFVNKGYCQEIVRKAFIDVGENFEKPTKASILKVLGNLKTFSANFRNPEIIEKHYEEIMKIMDKL